MDDVVRTIERVIVAMVILWPFHVFCIGMLALLCQDALAKRRVTIRSLLALMTVVGMDLAMLRLVVMFSS